MSLSREEEYTLILQAKVGDEEALTRLLKAHEGPIRALARQYGGGEREEEKDYYQEGCIGFIKAVRTFDPHHGTRLWTYAKRAVVQHILRAFCRWHGLSSQAYRWYSKVRRAWDRLCKARQQEPTAEEVAREVALAKLAREALRKERRAQGSERKPTQAEIEAWTAKHAHDPDWEERVEKMAGRLQPTVEELMAVWAGRKVPLSGDMDEWEEEGERGGVVVSDAGPGPEEQVEREEERNRHLQISQDRLVTCLGRPAAKKFLVLFILRDWEGYALQWADICGLLDTRQDSLAPPWHQVVTDEFPRLTLVPLHWSEVHALFRAPPPTLTEAALRQWYSRTAGKAKSCL